MGTCRTLRVLSQTELARVLIWSHPGWWLAIVPSALDSIPLQISLRPVRASTNPDAKPWHYGLRMPMISPIVRLVARPELSRLKLTSRPTRLKKEVALAGKTSPFG